MEKAKNLRLGLVCFLSNDLSLVVFMGWILDEIQFEGIKGRRPKSFLSEIT